MSSQRDDCLAEIEKVLSGEIRATSIESCIEELKEGRASDVVPILDRVLHYWRLPVAVHSATIKTLGHFGTVSAIETICSVFTNRTYSSSYDGFDKVEHDLLCKVAAGEICAIGTSEAFQEFIKQIDRAVQIEGYGLEWLRFDVRDVLKGEIPASAQRNLIYALLDQPLSHETRQRLLAYLRRDAQTAQLLAETLSPGQPGYLAGRDYLSALQVHLNKAASYGDDPTKHTYVTIEHPPNMDTSTAIQYRALFSQARIPTLSRQVLDRINAELRTVELPPIDTSVEVPLAHLKIDYPYQSRLASLKHATMSRSDVGVHWVSIDAVSPLNKSEGATVKSGDLVLTSLRLIVAWKSVPQPDIPKDSNGERTAIIMLLLRDIDDVKSEFPVIELHFAESYSTLARVNVRASIAYPGASLLSAISGLSLPGASVEEKLTAAETREYNRTLDAKRGAAEVALNQFFVDIVNRNLSHGTSVRAF